MRLALAIAIGALLTSVIFAITPPRFHASEITWQPNGPEDSGALRLTRRHPEKVTVETTCAALRAHAQPGVPALNLGELLLDLDGDQLSLHPLEVEGASVTLPTGDCAVTGLYHLSDSRLTLTAGTDTASATVSPPAVFRLSATGNAVESVIIKTQASGLAASWSRWAIGLTSLLGCFGALALSRRSRPRADTDPDQTSSRRRLRTWWGALDPVDLVVLVALIALAFIVPAQYDEGWVMVRSEALGRGWFGNVYETEDAWLPQGLWHEFVYYQLQRAGLGFIHLRLVVALVLSGTWVVLRAHVISHFVGTQASRWPPVAATYLAFCGVGLMSLRAEPVVVVLGVLALAAWVSYLRRPGPLPLFVGLVSCGAAVAAHQTGWVTLSPAALLLAATLSTVRKDRNQLAPLLAATLSAGAFAILVMFAAVDLRTVADGAETFGAAGHELLIMNEPQRFIMTFNGETAAARAFMVPLLITLVVVGSPGVGQNVGRRALWTAGVAWIGGVVFTSSKWPIHLGVEAVPAVLMAALIASAWQGRRTTFPGRGALLVMLLLGAATSFTVAGFWGYRDLASLDWVKFSRLMTDGHARSMWYPAIALFALLGWIANSWQPARRFATAAICLAVILPMATSLGWVLRDAARPGWSAASANVRNVFAQDDCGPLSDSSLPATAQPLDETAELQWGGKPLAPGAFPRVSELAAGPLGELETWGTWASPEEGQTPDANTGRFATPSYAVSDVDEIVFWSVSGDPSTQSMWAEFQTVDGALPSDAVETSTAPEWRLHRLPVPPDATSVRIRVEDDSAGYGGWSAVSTPVWHHATTPAEAFANASVYVPPAVATRYPCMRMPSLAGGYWHEFEYVVDDPTYLWLPDFPDLTVTQIGCEDETHCLRNLDYPMAEVTVRRVTS